jgi:hypothetical protein
MGCLITIFSVFIPRTTLLFMWLFSYTYNSFQTYLWPILGFILMPVTTCFYAIIVHGNPSPLSSFDIFCIIIGIVLDILHWINFFDD